MARRSRTKVSKLEVPASEGLIAPEPADELTGPVRDPFLSVRSSGYGTFSTLSLNVMGDVCRKLPIGTVTPACAQVAPPGPEHLLAIIPCKRDADQIHTISWSADRKRASMRLRRVLTKVDVPLPGPGFVLELPVQAFNHPTKGWCVGVATRGTTRPEVKRGSRKARPAAATPTPAAEAAPAAAEPEDDEPED